MAVVGPAVEAVQESGSIIRSRECLPPRIKRIGVLLYYSGSLLLAGSEITVRLDGS